MNSCSLQISIYDKQKKRIAELLEFLRISDYKLLNNLCDLIVIFLSKFLYCKVN